MKTHEERARGESRQLFKRPPDRSVMSPRLIARLFRRLDASPLPYAERLDLEAEVLGFLRSKSPMRAPPFVLVVHEDACGDHDTSIPN